MKKGLIITLSIFLALVLLAAGLFFWKGGHHALVLADILEEWLDADDADQSLTVMVQTPGIRVDKETGRVEPHIRQLRLKADTFWTEYADRPLFGLTVQGAAAYTDGKTLYMDTGKAYALPDMSGLRKSARKLAWGLLLHGRVTKHGDTYEISMNTDDLELYLDITADSSVRTATVMAVLPDDTAVHVFMTSLSTKSHAVPQNVLDAMVRTKMEQPMALSEPLGVLLPAAEQLLPLSGDLELGVDCGILELSETVGFRLDETKAELERTGIIITIDLPDELSGMDPAALALMILRSGEFIREGEAAVFRVNLPAETTDELCAVLVPQIGELGIGFDGSEAVLTIVDQKLTSISLTAEGSVPFLVTTIPVAFHGTLTVN